jgi:hypothetical protein
MEVHFDDNIIEVFVTSSTEIFHPKGVVTQQAEVFHFVGVLGDEIIQFIDFAFSFNITPI